MGEGVTPLFLYAPKILNFAQSITSLLRCPGISLSGRRRYVSAAGPRTLPAEGQTRPYGPPPPGPPKDPGNRSSRKRLKRRQTADLMYISCVPEDLVVSFNFIQQKNLVLSVCLCVLLRWWENRLPRKFRTCKRNMQGLYVRLGNLPSNQNLVFAAGKCPRECCPLESGTENRLLCLRRNWSPVSCVSFWFGCLVRSRKLCHAVQIFPCFVRKTKKFTA